MTGGRSANDARDEAVQRGWTRDLVCPACRPGRYKYLAVDDDDKRAM